MFNNLAGNESLQGYFYVLLNFFFVIFSPHDVCTYALCAEENAVGIQSVYFLLCSV